MSEINSRIFSQFPFTPRGKSRSLFTGGHQSPFVSEGMEFWELRPYTRGDSFRKIHWRHYAKTGELEIREQISERNLSIWLAEDFSGSMFFGAKQGLIDGFYSFLENLAKSDYSNIAIVGFSDRIDFYASPRLGRRAEQTIYPEKAKLARTTDNKIANPKILSAFLSRKAKAGDVVFLLSDFLFSENPGIPLNQLAPKCEIIPVIVRDPREELPGLKNTRVSMRDLETGATKMTAGLSSLDLVDQRLTAEFDRLLLDPLWIRGTSQRESADCIVLWLADRSKATKNKR